MPNRWAWLTQMCNLPRGSRLTSICRLLPVIAAGSETYRAAWFDFAASIVLSFRENVKAALHGVGAALPSGVFSILFS